MPNKIKASDKKAEEPIESNLISSILKNSIGVIAAPITAN